MDSIIPMGGLQLPFQRRLSRLYNDTKKSSDFVKEAVQHAEADPEIKALHRKLRIQKDRLVSWGLEWSDPNQSAEVLIDSSLSKAGLSEVVGSIMSTIKDILAEAEPLWHSSRRLAGERVEAEKPPKMGEKIKLVVWDKNRFEDLVRDLTTSIDTLYDLSRTRSSYAQSSAAARERLFKTPASTEDMRPFESSRMQTPQQIDPQTLTNLRSMQAVPMTELAEGERGREIVFMSKQAYSALTHGSAGRQPYAPLLLEYASFDPIFSTTGIPPPMTRFEKLSAGLQTDSQRSPGSWIGLPWLLGYFEDMDNSRFGLVYQFPPTFNPVTFEHLTQNPLYNLCSLADLLVRPDFEPKLEAKFRLAANLANTVFDMHARGITHGNLGDQNISFCNAVGTEPGVSGITQGEVDIRRPLISAFDLFSESESQDASQPFSLYRHPLDPRSMTHSPLASKADSKTFDLYSLAMVLLSIGLWTKVENLVPDASSAAVPESVLEQLAIRCGSLYMKAVQACWNAVDQEMAGQQSAEQIVARVQFKASRYLEACCILDGVSNLEERLGDDLGESNASARVSTPSLAGPSRDSKTESSRSAPTRIPTGAWAEKEARPSSSPVRSTDDVRARIEAGGTTTDIPVKQASAKVRLYPHVSLPPDIVEHWNTTLMPQINTALRHFYRKNPESVEVSLESIGESPQKTKPTVLVVCTSVSKVRAILKRKLGFLFDGKTGLALKVCRGQVLRSRNQGVGRSMAKGAGDNQEDVAAANPDYQERPKNGASIGAWIGDRHLPPVSFGGLIMVDDRPYGMTVHHMLDDPDQDGGTATTKGDTSRSMARTQGLPDLAAWYAEQYQNAESETDSSGTEDYACEFSDSGSDTYSESAITSEASDEEEGDDDQYNEPGDIPGIEPGCGDGYIVTQPALDDVKDGFYPSPETQDEDHLDTYSLGEVYASSGIRRRTEHGLVHEIDWALFEFRHERKPDQNRIIRAKSVGVGRKRATSNSPASPIGEQTLLPTCVAPTSSLPGLEVQCMARTSGLQTGLILPTITSVKIYGRTSPSHTYQVSGTPSKGIPTAGSDEQRLTRPLPMGIPGDSGAWVVDRHQGQVCGHVLAWSERKRVAYICPMEVLLLDVLETLEASEIRLPGGQVAVANSSPYHRRTSRVTDVSEVSEEGSARGWEGGDEDEEVPNLVAGQQKRGKGRMQTGTRSSYFLEPQHGPALDGGDDKHDSYDEGVEVELANDIKQMHLAGHGMPMEMGRWGVS
ncbi:hypothetical protein QBC46DRAFT_354362 [Diplogelasinospora grovesii]|uniref:HET-s/LopB domain-containing protein n=1 Tax=Diplogelasinospora grovesii TaxID=303347 RepID=A0AAN6N6R2_9PEZI|nr:hypothetical protein QBC46DRAFT_354362 [Diplogelasinospora grovesii]